MEQMFFPVTQKKAAQSGIGRSSEANKNALFPTQLRNLRKEKGVSQEELSKILGVSKSTLGLWETGDTLPDARSLHDLAVYYEVSADYLLGLSNVKTNDMAVKTICEYTGLTPLTVSTLNTMITIGPLISDFISRFFEDIIAFDSHSIEYICSDIVKSSRAYTVYNKLCEGEDESNAICNANIEASNIIDIANENIDGYYKISGLDAADYFMERAKDIASCSINGIIEEMISELSSEGVKSGITDLTRAKIWKTFDEEEKEE